MVPLQAVVQLRMEESESKEGCLHLRISGDAAGEGFEQVALEALHRRGLGLKVIVDLTELTLAPTQGDDLLSFHRRLSVYTRRTAYLVDRSWIRGMLLSVLRDDQEAKPVATLKQAQQWLGSNGGREESAANETKSVLRRLSRGSRAERRAGYGGA